MINIFFFLFFKGKSKINIWGNHGLKCLNIAAKQNKTNENEKKCNSKVSLMDLVITVINIFF